MENSQDDNLLIQSYFTVALLSELNNLDSLNSDYFKSAKFESDFVKKSLSSVGIDNQGALLMYLYTMLVIPKQLLENEFHIEFNMLNTIVGKLKSKAISSYKSDSAGIDYIRHMRNSVAHASVSFVSNQKVTFSDKNNRDEKCETVIPLVLIGHFLTALQNVFFKYIKQLKLNTLSHDL